VDRGAQKSAGLHRRREELMRHERIDDQRKQTKVCITVLKAPVG
jgi:hypothetical protein